MRIIVLVVVVILGFTPPNADTQDLGRRGGWSFQTQDLAVIAGGLSLARALHRWDHRTNSGLDENPVLEATDFTNLYGATSFNLPASLLYWAYARHTGDESARQLSTDILKSLLYVQAIVGPVKHLVGRERPDGSNSLSFPSGHTANAFALAELARGRTGWKAGAPFYALGVLTGLGRMENNVHYLSDVVAGAAIGYVIGRAVNRERSFGTSIVPFGLGMVFTRSF